MEKRRFSLYARACKHGKPIFYCRFRKKDGSWGPGQSTACTSEGAARAWAESRIASGEIPAAPGDCPSLTAWAEGFYFAGGRYDQAKRARGRELSPGHLSICGHHVTRYLIPAFGTKRLSEITPMDLERYFLDWFSRGTHSGSTLNGVLKAAKGLFGEAERLGVIRENPCRRIGKFSDKGRERSALSQEELDRLFALDALATVWVGHRVPMLAAMLAAGCGLRHGEILALRPCDLRGTVLMVTRAWNTAAGAFRKPKWDSIREVPLPPRLQAELADFITEKGLASEDLLFPGPDPTRPLTQASIVPAVRAAYVTIGIPLEEQRPSRRYVDVHSLRHTYITMLRVGDVPDWQLERAAGHRSAGMTRRYTHTRGEDLQAVADTKILPFKEKAG